jgi:eukaryotic-like serine/threonine-protein kinase
MGVDVAGVIETMGESVVSWNPGDQVFYHTTWRKDGSYAEFNVAPAHTFAAISMPGAFAGTPKFASPEQFAGIGVDIRSDLYSLGVVLWVMVTGHSVFRGSPAEIMYQHQHAPLPLERLKDFPQPVEVLLEKLLEKDPAQRFQTPDELLRAIPKITDAIDARRRITHQSFQKNAPALSVEKGFSL